MNVLLIEDNANDARLIHGMLGQAGNRFFNLHRVERLAGGLERLAQGDISLVLLDLSLPDSKELETFRRVHSAFPSVPVIVMSGLDDQDIAVDAVHEGAQDYLVKGQVNGPLLVRAMRYALERMRTAEQLARYAEELRVRNAQMESDLAMAREVQQVFLPQEYPTFPGGVAPARSALNFHHRYLPAAAMSGDFFSVFRLSDTAAGIFLCDVMGHGMRAALVTAIMRGLVEQLRPVAAHAGQLLGEINQSLFAIFQRTEQPILATALYLILDVANRKALFASAGHPSPFRLRRRSGQVEKLTSYDPQHGPALGLFADSPFPVGSCPLDADDLFFLFTDGLFEVAGLQDKEEFGQERLLQTVRERVALPADQLFEQVLGAVKQFSGGKEFEDDVCMVCAEVANLEALGRLDP